MTVANTDPMATPDDRPGYIIHSVGWLQRALNRLGFCVGAQDGFWGDHTQQGLDRYIAGRSITTPIAAYYVNGPQTMEVMLHKSVSTALSREQLPAASRCTQQRQAVPAPVPLPVDSTPRVLYVAIAGGVALLLAVGLMWAAGRKR